MSVPPLDLASPLDPTARFPTRAPEDECGLHGGTCERVIFAECLREDSLASLHHHLARLADSLHLPLQVDLLPMLEPATFRPLAETILLFDLHRLLVLRPRAEGADAESALRYLLGAYPIQPRARLAAHLRTNGFRFFYPLGTLDLVPAVIDELDTGELAMLDLTTGSISRRQILEHVEAAPAAAILAASSAPERAPRDERFGRLEERRVDASLRAGFPRRLDDLVGAAAVVQRRFTVRERLALPFTTAEVCWDDGRHREACYGKTTREDRAETVAVCEALERFQVATRPPTTALVHGSYDELSDRAVDPRTLFFGGEVFGGDVFGGEVFGGEFGDDRTADASSLPPFDPTAPLYWTWASPAGGAEPALVPAQEVWFFTDRLPSETMFIQPTTNACALGGSREEAALFALLEATERDAFLTTWYLRRPARPIELGSITDPSFHHVRHRWQLAYPAYRAKLFDITTDLGLPVVMALAIRRDDWRDRAAAGALPGPKVFVAIACRLDAEAACRAALVDLAGFEPEMTPHRRARYEALHREPSTIEGPADHFGYYALDEPFRNLSFLDLGTDQDAERSVTVAAIQAEALTEATEGYELCSVLRAVEATWAPLGAGVYFRDLTHPLAEARGLHCVKAITPGLYPIWFGAGSRRFRPTRRLERLARAWLPPELLVDGAPPAINRRLHPFS
ncbi:MAG: YcaO-like family protein [Acidobacteriota bacterium]